MDAMRPDLSAGNRLALEVADLGRRTYGQRCLAIADLYEVEDVDGMLTRELDLPSLGRKAF